MAVKITDKDLGMKRILRDIKRSNGAGVRVGWIGGEQHPGGDISVTQIAMVHEFGSRKRNIPARPTLRPTFDKNRRRYRKLLAAEYGRMIDGKISVARALIAVGLQAEGDVKLAITKLKSPRLKRSTILGKSRTIGQKSRRKSFEQSAGNPLIDTGIMRDRVTHKLEVSG